MRDLVEECEEIGYAKSLVDGLTAALADVDPTAPPGRIAAVPADWVAEPGDAVPNRLAAQESISFVRCAKQAPGIEVAARFAAVRIGVLRRLSEHVVEHLSGRMSGGEPIIRKQLVQASIVDAHTELEAARRRLQVAGTVPVVVTELHDRLTTVDWELARLLGASGFITDGGARASYVARLIATCWTPRKAHA
jgi:Acyl-CoA dehydrogenase, C-terminal domain